MVILTMRIDEISPFELSEKIRAANNSIPILLLLNDNSEINLIREKQSRLCFDKIFVWNGDSKIFLAMIKYIEDKINAVKDTKIGLVRVILMVEDSIQDYSGYLPILYTEIMKQTQRIIADEHLDEMKKLLRMRARPKLLMAESYEQAVEIIDTYQDYLLCVISDIKFPKNGERNEKAGLELIDYVRTKTKHLPILLQSADPENESRAAQIGTIFLNKNSKSLTRELTDFIFRYLGFGDFIFRDAGGTPIDRARSMGEFKELLLKVPDSSLVYHANHNHFSGWLMARGEIQIAKNLQPVQVSDFPTYSGLREHLIGVFQAVQDSKTRGKVIQFSETALDTEFQVLRLAEGSLGGKGRGMAFLHMLIANCELNQVVPEANILIPQTSVVATEEYDRFIEHNRLADLFGSDADFSEVKRRFVQGSLSPGLREKLSLLLQKITGPLSIRSSGIFEDSLSQPFSGIYDTFMLPNNHPDLKQRLCDLEQAIKLVYASIFSASARAYFDAIGYKIGDEKMAVLIQGVVGSRHGRHYYPHFAGVAQSYNYYPLSYLKPEDGIAVLGFGLGKYVIDGEKAYRFCPKFPKLEFVTPEDQLQQTQTSFYSLNMERDQVQLASGDDATLTRMDIAAAQDHGTLDSCISTWDYQNNRLQVGGSYQGPKVVNFANILKYESFPLARIIETVLDIVKSAMGTPVEIEFAVDLNKDPDGKASFYILQIKPLLGDLEDFNLNLADTNRDQLFLYSEHAMGNGKVDELEDIVYVDPDTFDRSRTHSMAMELEQLNSGLKSKGRRYILVGPGRWGSRDPWLGIPVNWSHISNAKIIVEVELEDFKVDPSLGSHFFHNVTSMNIGYFDIPYQSKTDFIDWHWIKLQELKSRTEHLVHARSRRPMVVKMDGRKSISVIYRG